MQSFPHSGDVFAVTFPAHMSEQEKQILVNSIGDTFLPEAELWLDPHRPRDIAFVSHAHADHFATHGKIITSAANQRIVEARFNARKSEFLGLEFGEIHDLKNGFEIKMLPAGHIAGSSMLHITRQEDGASLLHTGDFKLRPGFSAEKCQAEQADTLIMETTFGLPKFRLPPSDETHSRMAQFAVNSIENGKIPVFLAYSLGKAQEVLMALHHLVPSLEFQVHPSVAKMNKVVAELGFQLPACTEFSPDNRSPENHVLVIPPNAMKSDAVQKFRKQFRIAMVTGWGVDSSAKYRYRADEVFPLSDHADYDDLHRFVEMVNPSLVLTIHGSVNEFARDLRARGIEARPLEESAQSELDFDDSTGLAHRLHPLESEDSLPDSEFGEFTRTIRAADLAIGKPAKEKILQKYLSGLDPEKRRTVKAWLHGKISLVEWSVVRRSLLEVSDLSLGEFRQICPSKADAATSAHPILSGKTNFRGHSILEVHQFFLSLENPSGAMAKLGLLTEILRNLHPLEGALIVAILTGQLPRGLGPGID